MIGKLFLWGASAVIVGFGVAGWALSEGDFWQRSILGTLTAISGGVIPSIVGTIGRTRASSLALFTVLVFGAIGAYSFHHAVEVLVEGPRKAVHTAEVEGDYAAAQTRVDTTQARVEAFRPLVLSACKCPETKKSETAAWQAERAPLDAALATAKTEWDTARNRRDAAKSNYKPLAPDWAVWLLAIAVDIAIAVGIFSIESAERKAKKDAEAEATCKAEAELDAEMAATITAATGTARAKVSLLREAAERLRTAA